MSERSEMLVVDGVFPELDLAALPAEEAVVIRLALEAVHAAELLQAPVVGLIVRKHLGVLVGVKCLNYLGHTG